MHISNGWINAEDGCKRERRRTHVPSAILRCGYPGKRLVALVGYARRNAVHYVTCISPLYRKLFMLCMHRTTFSIGTRSSKLALKQTELVVEQLKSVFGDKYEFKIETVFARGDTFQNAALNSFSIESAFCSELEEWLLQSKIDMAVHSAKDLPIKCPDSLTIAGYLPRGDSCDVLVISKKHLKISNILSLEELPDNFIIGTSSIRREKFIAHFAPHIKCKPIRGNIQTRIQKLDSDMHDFDALILAAAALERIGLSQRISLRLNEFLHAPGQAAIAVECRKSDSEIWAIIQKINHRSTFLCVEAERHLLHLLNGGCSLPIAVYTSLCCNDCEFYMEVILADENLLITCKSQRKVESIAEAVREIYTTIGTQKLKLPPI